MELTKRDLEIAGQLYRGQLDHLTGKQIREMLEMGRGNRRKVEKEKSACRSCITYDIRKIDKEPG